MKKSQKPAGKQPEETLEQQALSQLNSGNYKEAIGLYKQLWGMSDDKNHQKQIAYCYLQRASSFAQRGMIKEALVLWDNYTQFAKAPYDAYDHYISWLIQANNKAKIQEALKLLSADQLDKQYPELAVLLGFLILTNHPEYQQDLPQDSAFIAHLMIAQVALQAYQEENKIALNEALKQLPYRSAFRDFRSLLAGVQSFPETIEQVSAKIPETSPYFSTAQLLLACTLNGSELIQALTKFSHKQRRLIAEIKGFDKKQQKFIESLIQNQGRLNDKIKFNLVIQNQVLCGSDLAHRFCQATLASYSAGRRDFNKHFTEISTFEKNRLKALICERENDEYNAEHHWRLCINELLNADTDSRQKIALILRHIATRLPSDSEYHNQLLIESLQYDDQDLPSYLKILRYFSHYEEDIKDYKQWLKQTIEKFPQNIEVLSLAINTATRNKAYKKATQYAAKILKIDPLNTFAKDILFSSHLAHARRMIQAKKYPLAEKEIKQAEKLKLGKKYLAQTELMHGLFSFASQDKNQGLKLIAEALNKVHTDPVNAHLQATMEALLTGLPVASILKGLSPAKGHLLTEQELSAVIKQLDHYGKEPDNQSLLHKAIEKIKPALKASLSQQSYDEELLLSLCETLDAINAFEMLRHCVKVSIDKWKTPIWRYYHIYAERNGRAESCTDLHIYRLEDAREQAYKDNDKRATLLIGAFIERYYQAHPERTMGFLDSLFGTNAENDMENLLGSKLDQLFDHLSDAVFDKIDIKAEKLIETTSPERLVKELIKDANNNQQVLLAIMKDPDLLSALMFVKAAKSLKIDIDVSINDVLEFFNADDSPDSFPF
jgi:hypothetical protein